MPLLLTGYGNKPGDNYQEDIEVEPHHLIFDHEASWESCMTSFSVYKDGQGGSIIADKTETYEDPEHKSYRANLGIERESSAIQLPR